jgi:hypothetical protein
VSLNNISFQNVLRIESCFLAIVFCTPTYAIVVLLEKYTRQKRIAKINMMFWEELIAYFSWYDTGHIENDASNNSSIVACVFITAVTFLPSRCLATIRGLLPSLCLATIRGYTDTHTHRQQRDLISLLLFFQNKESRLKRALRSILQW